MPPLIALRGLEKSYAHGPGRTYVLRQITLDVEDGDFVSIMGPSGAGKSTLLHILGMHDSDWTGEYRFLDQPVHALKPKRRVARAVIANPRLILADESTGNLHSSQGREIMDLFKRLNDEGTTIIQVTHSEANGSYGRRIVMLRDGWIVDP